MVTALVGIDSLVSTAGSFADGRPHLAGTRVTVAWIAALAAEGLTPTEIVGDVFEGRLTLAQVHAALSYYHQNREAIDAVERARDRDYASRAAASESLADRPR